MKETDLGNGKFLIEMTPEEIENLNKVGVISVRLCLKAQDIVTERKGPEKTDSEIERQIGGILHAITNENLSIEEAEARIKLTVELNTSNESAEDR